MVLRWWDMLGSMAMREMVPIGVGHGFLDVLASGGVSVVVDLDSVSFSVSGVVVVGAGDGRQIMHPIRHFSRNYL